MGAFDGPRPQQPHERAPLLPKPYRQAGGSVLLLGTSLCIENNVNDVRVVSRRPRVPQSGECSVAVLDSRGVEMDNSLTSGRAGGNLHGVLSDIEKMRRYFLRVGSSSATSNKSMTYNVFEAWSQRRNEGKKEMVRTIRAFFAQEDIKVFVIYYSGHGTPSGDWAIGRTNRSGQQIAEVITAEELLSLWRAQPGCHCCHSPEPRDAHLIVIADSCHSGAWVLKIDELKWNVHNVNVSMVASCKAEETCTDTLNGGDFTAHLLQEPGDRILSFSPVYTEDIRRAAFNLAVVIMIAKSASIRYGGGEPCLDLLLCCFCWPLFYFRCCCHSNE